MSELHSAIRGASACEITVSSFTEMHKTCRSLRRTQLWPNNAANMKSKSVKPADPTCKLTSAFEGKSRRRAISLPALTAERLRTAKAIVDKTVKMQKVFCIRGPYPVIRAALRARGWVEQRLHRPNQSHVQPCNESRSSYNDSGDSDSDDDNTDDVEKEEDLEELYDLMSRLLRNEKVNFYWTNSRNAVNSYHLQKEQIINHFAKAGSFTTKAGLCVNLRSLHWFDTADPDTFFPRCYRLGMKDEKNAFIEDYRRTACISLLKYIVAMEKDAEAMETNQRVECTQPSRPVVCSKLVDRAIRVCQEFLECLEHTDIDIGVDTPQLLTEDEWTDFLECYYLVVHDGAQIEMTTTLATCCEKVLQRLAEVRPQHDIEGIYNIWIIKPGAKSRGRGIKCAKRLDQILRLVDSDLTLIKDSKWVVQKYLEQPLLVHGTKFDVRQWFLVTDWNPLTVWFYKKCYLRFATQPYSLDTLDSSVHLCNNSIQKHLRPSPLRHHIIPADNMWSDDQFKKFLSSQGKKTLWDTVVVPGMKKAVIHAVQTTQDLVDSRKNTFELYGADFMLGCDLRPWLLEINASPSMAASTTVTEHLCAAVQEDTLRVVLDRKADRTANTGDFQLIYKQAAIEAPQQTGVNLLVEGFQIKHSCPLRPLKSSNRQTAKQLADTIKKKESSAPKVKPLPKMVKNAETKTQVFWHKKTLEISKTVSVKVKSC